MNELRLMVLLRNAIEMLEDEFGLEYALDQLGMSYSEYEEIYKGA